MLLNTLPCTGRPPTTKKGCKVKASCSIGSWQRARVIPVFFLVFNEAGGEDSVVKGGLEKKGGQTPLSHVSQQGAGQHAVGSKASSLTAATSYIVIWSKLTASVGLYPFIYHLDVIIVLASKMTVRIEITGKNSGCLVKRSTQRTSSLVSATRTKMGSGRAPF